MIAVATLQGGHKGNCNHWTQTFSSKLSKYPAEGYTQLKEICTWAGSLRTICILCLWCMNVVRNCPLNCPKPFHTQTTKEQLPGNYCALQPPFRSSGQSLAVFQFPLHQSVPEYFHLWCLQKDSYPAYMQDQPTRKHTKYFWSTLNGIFFGTASVIYDPPCYNLLHNYVIFNLVSNKPREHFSCLLFTTVYWMLPQ